MPERVALLGQYSRFAGYAAGLDGTPLNRRSVNDGKVTDHHALITVSYTHLFFVSILQS